VVLSAAGIAGLIAQTPVGAFVDGLRYKREALALGTALLGIGALTIVFFHSFAEFLPRKSPWVWWAHSSRRPWLA